MTMKHYVIISDGAYSDYSPQYFVGDREITQKELKKKAKEVENELIKEYEALPERKHICENNFLGYGCVDCLGLTKLQKTSKKEKYNPKTKEVVFSPFNEGEFVKRLTKWLNKEGFERIPTNIPEINLKYGCYEIS